MINILFVLELGTWEEKREDLPFLLFIYFCVSLKNSDGDNPGGPVVRNQPSNAGMQIWPRAGN